MLATLALAVGVAAHARRSRGSVKVLAWLVFAGTLAQAPLGAITVYYDLNPYLVISHLLLSLAVLGLGVLVLLEATRTVRGGGAVAAGDRARSAARCCSRPSACSSSPARSRPRRAPQPGGDGGAPASARSSRRSRAREGGRGLRHRLPRARRLGVARARALSVAHPRLRRAARAPRRADGDRRDAVPERHVPWWLVLIHVTVAACVFAWTVGLVARLWRPVAPERT